MGGKRIDIVLATLTVVGTFASIGALAPAIRTVCLVCLGLSAVGFTGYALLKKRPPLQSLESLRPELFTIERASVEDIRWIAELEARKYSRRDAVPERVLRDWHAGNPNGFFVLKFEPLPKV